MKKYLPKRRYDAFHLFATTKGKSFNTVPNLSHLLQHACIRITNRSSVNQCANIEIVSAFL